MLSSAVPKRKGTKNIIPKKIVDAVNKVKSLFAEFLGHNAPRSPFSIGRELLLDKYFDDLPAGYTATIFPILEWCCNSKASRKHA